MPKVVLNKTTKINGSFVKAGESVDVSEEKKKELVKNGFISTMSVEISLDKGQMDEIKTKLDDAKSQNKVVVEENKALKSEKLALEKQIKDLEDAANKAAPATETKKAATKDDLMSKK